MANSSELFTTLYLLVGGEEPMERDTFEGVAAPVLATAFTAPEHSTVGVLTPQWRGAADETGALVGFDVSSTVLSGHVSAAQPYTYLTGVVWNLLNKSLPPDLATMRRNLRSSAYQDLSDSGFTVLQNDLQPYGTLGTSLGYYNWPALPGLPAQAVAVSKAPSSGVGIALGLLVAVGLLAKLQGR